MTVVQCRACLSALLFLPSLWLSYYISILSCIASLAASSCSEMAASLEALVTRTERTTREAVRRCFPTFHQTTSEHLQPEQVDAVDLSILKDL